jgi:hypothetical protein
MKIYPVAIGGAIAEWAWGEPRATQDLDLVVKIPIKAINRRECPKGWANYQFRYRDH